MKFIVKKSLIENVLSNLQSFVNKKDNTHITSHIYINAKSNSVILKATNFEIGLKSEIEAIVESEGIATANGTKLLRVIKNLKDDDIVFELQNDFLVIKQKRSKFTFPTFVPNEVFNFPKIEENNKINIESSNFLNSIKKINSVTDINNNKIELTGSLLDIRDYGINFVATDTKRLAVINFKSHGINNFYIIIPKNSVTEISKLFASDVEIYYSQSQLIIKNNSYYFFTKLINGKFPDYEKIIPKNFNNIIVLNRNVMIEELKRLNSISINIKLVINKNEILFYTSNNEANEYGEGQIDVQTNLENFEIGINSNYVLDFLSNINSNEFELCLNEQNTPFALKNDNFSTIVIPIIL